MSSSKFQIPYLSKRTIAQTARRFLIENGIDNDIPVPIEEVIDLNLGITICPTPNLKKETDCDAYTTDDFQTIFVDKALYDNEAQGRRLRFTLAHEIGHSILHQDLYRYFGIEDRTAYLKMQNSLNSDTYGIIEYQASTFAGYVLMPESVFKNEMEVFLKSIGGAHKVDILSIQPFLADISERFNVSELAIIFQIKRDFIEVHQKLEKFLIS